MLKRVITAAVGVVGLVLVGLGVASATIWKADDTLVATSQTGAHTYVTDPGVLELGGDPATVRVTAPGKDHVVLAIGRDTDVDGWVGTDAHARVTGLSGWHSLAVKSVAAKPTPTPTASPAADASAATAEPSPSATPATSATPKAADPTGSDLWVAEASGDGSATLKWSAEPGRWSLLAVGTGDGAPTLEISWPRVVTTPYLWPLVLIGTFLFLAALFVFLWDERRRHRGDEAMWVPVTTGAVPVAVATGASSGPLTRRQLREAAQAHATALGQDLAATRAASARKRGGAPAADTSVGATTASTAAGNGPATTPSGERGAVPANPPGRPGSDAPAPVRPAEPAPITAPTSRRALRAAATGSTPVQPMPGAQPAGRPTAAAPSGPPAAAGPVGQGSTARPAWVPVAPSGDQAAGSGRPSGDVPPHPVTQHPRWLGTGVGASSGTTAVPGPATTGAPGTGATLPPPGPQRPPGPAAPPAADDAAGAGSRADAWRRAWGLPPTEQDEAPRGEGRHGR